MRPEKNNWIALLVTALSLVLFAAGAHSQQPPQSPERREQARPGQRRPGHRPGWQPRGRRAQRPLRQLFLRVAPLSPEQQQRALQNDPLFQQLPPRLQESFRRRLAQFNSLPSNRRRLMLQQADPRRRERAVQALFLRVAPMAPEEQQQVLAADEFFQMLPPRARQNFRRHLERFNNHTPEERRRMLQRLEHFSELSPEQQEKVRRRARLFARMSPQQRQRARRIFQAWQDLPPERRQLLTERLRRLQQASPATRQALLEDSEFLAPLQPSERQLLSGLWHLRQAVPPPHATPGP